MERRGPSHLGPYGQACMSCFKSKCKCVARSDGPGCQRCHRLKRTCQPSDPARRRITHEKKDSDARIRQLEMKLDGLISRLEARDTLDNFDGGRGSQPPASRTGTKRTRQTAQALDSENSAPSLDVFAPEDTDREPQSEPDPDPAQDDGSGESLLGKFRSRMLPHFPFLHLPSELTADRLGAQRPLLLRAIVCVSSRRHKDSQSRELRRAMSEALLEETTDRIDLLLALLTYLSWGWDHSQLLPRLMLQAVSLACEIHAHLNSASMDAPEIRVLFLPDFEATDASPPPAQGDFLEHHRAVLGCFVLSSAVSTFLNHSIDALRWTPRMGEGLAALGASRECPTDAAFAVQVRLQLLAQKAIEIRQQQQMEQLGQMQAPAGTAPTTTALISLGMLQGELQGLRASTSMGTNTTNNLAHVWATDLAIHEMRYSVGSVVPFMVSHFSAMTTSSSPPKVGERGYSLWQCVDAAKACIDALLALQALEFAGMSLVQWTQLMRGLVVLHHLTISIEDPYWDRAAVRAVVDLLQLLDRVAEKLESAATALAERGQESEKILTSIASRMRGFCTALRGRGTVPEHGAGLEVRGHSIPNSSTRDLFHIPISDYTV